MENVMNGRKIKHAVITGANTMLGANLTRLLLSKGIRVTAVVHRSASNLPENAAGLRIISGELETIGEIEADSADAWFHFAWDGTYGDARNDEARQFRNAEYTLAAARKAETLGCGVFLFAGSQAEYGRIEGKLTEETPMNPVTAYGRAKKRAEEKLIETFSESRMDVILTRILSVYGPYDHPYTMVMSAVEAFLSGRGMSFTPGEQMWDYLYAEDAAEMFLRLSESGRKNEAYVIGSGDPRPLRDYILAIRDAVNPALSAGIGERPYNENQVMYLAADITKFIKDTGYRPQTDFETGIRKTIQSVK